MDCGVLWAKAPLPPPRLLHIHHNKAPCLLSGPRGRRPKAAAPQMRPKVANLAAKLPGADPTNTPTPPQRRGTRPSTPYIRCTSGTPTARGGGRKEHAPHALLFGPNTGTPKGGGG